MGRFKLKIKTTFRFRYHYPVHLKHGDWFPQMPFILHRTSSAGLAYNLVLKSQRDKLTSGK